MEKDGQTAGILYGFVDLADFADSITVTAFDGNAQIYVADRVTGDFLVDTWHNKLGNIFDDDILNRKVKSGYDFHEMKMDFVEGNAGHIAFWSNTAGEYFYSHYMPVGVDRWMVQMTVPESVVFAKAIQIRRVLYCVAAAEILSFAVYFLWVLSRVRRDTNQKISGWRSRFTCTTCSRPCLTPTKLRRCLPPRCRKKSYGSALTV